jgi:hypothetical protein
MNALIRVGQRGHRVDQQEPRHARQADQRPEGLQRAARGARQPEHDDAADQRRRGQPRAAAEGRSDGQIAHRGVQQLRAGDRAAESQRQYRGKLLTEKELYDRLNSTINRLDELTRNLNQGQGTAGQLLHDKQLYDNMNSAANELKGLIGDIRKDPKRYLNVRVSIF